MEILALTKVLEFHCSSIYYNLTIVYPSFLYSRGGAKVWTVEIELYSSLGAFDYSPAQESCYTLGLAPIWLRGSVGRVTVM